MLFGGCFCGVMFKALNSGIVVSEFELQSRYYVHFGTNTHGKRSEPPYPASNLLLVFKKDGFGIK